MPPPPGADDSHRNELERLRSALEQTKALFERAKETHGRAVELMYDLGRTHPDSGIRHATRIYVYTLQNYRKALRNFSNFLLRGTRPPESRQTVLRDMLDLLVIGTRADMGNIQVLDNAGNLKIVAQIGFERPFLDFFDGVHAGSCACGSALKAGQRVIVEDVMESPLYSADARTAMLDAGARSVQSTPIVSPSGQVVAVLSTHYRSTLSAKERDFLMADIIAELLAGQSDLFTSSGGDAGEKSD
jgi:hypothetical protein